MRYSPEHKEATRERIIRVAKRRFRRDGVASVSVASLMSDANLTHGGFYAHFENKAALVAEAVETAYSEMAAHLRSIAEAEVPGRKLGAVVREYCSLRHRDRPDRGCPMASIGSEFIRLGEVEREAGAHGLRHLRAVLEQCIAEDGSRQDPDAVLATLVGAVTIARVGGRSEASERVLSAVVAAYAG